MRKYRKIPVQSPDGVVWTWVDEQDADLTEYTWRLAGSKGSKGKYASRSIVKNGKSTTLYLHRIIAQRMGLIPAAIGSVGSRWRISVDHEDGNKLNNSRSNLKIKTRPQQMSNTNDGLRVTNKSGYRGVSFVKGREKFGKPWMAYVQANYKSKNLGWYATAEEAAEARRLWDEREK